MPYRALLAGSHEDLVERQRLYAKTASLNDRFPDLHAYRVGPHVDAPIKWISRHSKEELKVI